MRMQNNKTKIKVCNVARVLAHENPPTGADGGQRVSDPAVSQSESCNRRPADELIRLGSPGTDGGAASERRIPISPPSSLPSSDFPTHLRNIRFFGASQIKSQTRCFLPKMKLMMMNELTNQLRGAGGEHWELSFCQGVKHKTWRRHKKSLLWAFMEKQKTFRLFLSSSNRF